jgi:hypothetical protein
MERRKDELQPCRRRAVAADIHPTLSKLLGCASENGKLLDVSVQLNFGMKKAEAQARTAEAKEHRVRILRVARRPERDLAQ